MEKDNTFIDSTYVNTLYILEALNFYKEQFQMLSVPMCVDLNSIHTSIPEFKRNDIEILPRKNGSYYVGSAEQSFIYLHSRGFLKEGKSMALTPCQRDEVEDDIHLGIFLKLELIHLGIHNVSEMLDISFKFFSKFTQSIDVIDSGNKPHEKDIIINGIEVGSYGLGYMQDGTPYTYGTGIAEPRLSFALNKIN